MATLRFRDEEAFKRAGMDVVEGKGTKAPGAVVKAAAPPQPTGDGFTRLMFFIAGWLVGFTIGLLF